MSLEPPYLEDLSCLSKLDISFPSQISRAATRAGSVKASHHDSQVSGGKLPSVTADDTDGLRRSSRANTPERGVDDADDEAVNSPAQPAGSGRVPPTAPEATKRKLRKLSTSSAGVSSNHFRALVLRGDVQTCCQQF